MSLSKRIAQVAAKELLSATVTLLLLSTCVFFALRLLPGDPTTLILGEQASEQDRNLLRARLGLDVALPLQWSRFVWDLVCGQWGESLARPGLAVTSAVGHALIPTAQLATLSVAVGTSAGIFAASLSVGILRPKGRSVVHALILLTASVPLLSFGPFVTWLLAVRIPVVPLPGDPESGLAGLLFSAILLSLPLGAQVARVARAALLDQSHARYLDVARAKGAGPFRVLLLHALPVAAPTVIVVVAMQLGALLGGAVVLERLFERPGLGSLMLEAYRTRDLPVLEAAIIAAGALFVASQCAAQFVTVSLDPRRGERSESD